MQFYELLAVETLLIAVLAWRLWAKTRSVSFVFGAALLYYWTLAGAWVLVHDKLSSGPGQDYHYSYFETRLFPVSLDGSYFEALVLYALFIAVVLAVTLMAVRTPQDGSRKFRPLMVSHWRLILLAGVAGLCSYAIVRSSLAEAAQLNASGYVFTRSVMAHNPLFSLQQLLNRLSLLSLMLGLAIMASGPDARYLVARRSRSALFGYAVVACGMLTLLIVLGDRNELVFSVLVALLFYIANARRPRMARLVVMSLVALAGLSLITYLRDAGLTETKQALAEYDPSSTFTLLQTSNEQFAAHFSMYGVLRYHIPLTYGSSFVSLAESVVPRILWRNRPPDIYDYYAKTIRAEVGQGYTIHHAAAWYLNFGVAGVLMGAIVMGLLWAWCFNTAHRRVPFSGGFWTGALILAPWTFVAHLPMILRIGPEGYKDWALETMLLPAVIVAVVRIRKAARSRVAIRPQRAYQYPVGVVAPHQR